jgi:hypothetical protein
MDAFHRLSRFSIVKERASLVWKSAMVHLARGWQWLIPRRRMVFWTAGISIALALLAVIVPRVGEPLSWFWKASQADRDKVSPFLAPLASVVGTLATLAVGVFLARAALRQARIATRVAEIAAQQAQTAGERHEEQTKADFRRRITESFSKAAEQLASDKLEARLGGIYTLERISIESPDDYWTVMETLTAFVRERSRRNEAERTSQDLEQRVSRRAYFLWREASQPAGGAEERWVKAVEREELGEPPAADIAAVLTVIKRRSEPNRAREGTNAWRLDLSGAVLKLASLRGVHLEGANLQGAHLERTDLIEAHLEAANLMQAHLETAYLGRAHIEGAYLWGAHLEEAILWGTHLEGANLTEAHLEEASFDDTHLEAAFLWGATGLSEAQLAGVYGDARTQLPAGLARPPHWPPPGTGIVVTA